MAGYTSRIFLALTIPSVFGFLSVLWFLKKKDPSSKQLNKAVQVENSTLSNIPDQYQVLNPMKLKNDNCSSRGEDSSTEMQLKETQTSPEKQSNGVSQQNPKIKEKKKGKSKVCENGTSCLPKECLTNGCGKDSVTHATEDSEIGLTNGIEALSLSPNPPVKDEVNVHVVNKTCTEMENSNSYQELPNGSEENTNSCLLSNAAAVSTDVDTKEKDVMNFTEVNVENKESHQENVVETAKEQCDTDMQKSTNSCLTVDKPLILTDSINESSVDDVQTCTNETVLPMLPVQDIQTNNSEPLMLPVDCPVAETQGDMLESPGAKYCDSVGSNDSGKGASEFQFILEPQQCYMVYEFEILQELCGLLIGRNGRHVNYIKRETNANILIKRHPVFPERKICSITGTEDEIHASLKFIRKRFPVELYPSVTLSQVNSLPFEMQLPETLKLSLPEGVSFEAMLCATVNAGHFFLQQPTHPTFHSLPDLNHQMTASYSQVDAPTLSHLAKGYVCAASLSDGWYRAEIDEVFEEADECRLKFLDYGGYTIVPRASLRQIRFDFMNVPFQATECYLGSVTFLEGEIGWSAEATAAFEELAQGQIVQGYIVGYAENRVPYVHLYKITGATSVFINRELVTRGVARWIAMYQ